MFLLPEENFWLLLWLIPWKLWAIWTAARRDQLGWFICFWFVNFYAIPEAAYLIWSKKNRHRFHWD